MKAWEPLHRVTGAGLVAIINAHRKHGLETNLTVWANGDYEVFAHEYLPGQVHLSIKRYDRAPDMPWRHLQQIKLEVCGPESEAIELFPAESRLVDNANQRHLWVTLEPMEDGVAGALEGSGGVKVTDLLVIPRDPRYLTVGWDHGMVTSDEAIAEYNAADHPGKQEPWQPGLTTGRNERNVVHDHVEEIDD